MPDTLRRNLSKTRHLSTLAQLHQISYF